MGKYILKRLGYMAIVLLILSFLMFFVYSLIPYDRAVAEAEPYRKGLKTTENAAELYQAKVEELRRELGTDQNVVVRYLAGSAWRLSTENTTGSSRGTWDTAIHSTAAPGKCWRIR